MAGDQTHRQVRVNKMDPHVESIGHGVLAAGTLLLAFLYLGAYLRAGFEGVIDAVNPLRPESYMSLLTLTPGVILIWVGRKMSSR